MHSIALLDIIGRCVAAHSLGCRLFTQLFVSANSLVKQDISSVLRI